MAFYLYKREQREAEDKPKGWFEQVKKVTLGGETFRNLWKQHRPPLDQGWHITRDNLIDILTEGKGNSDSNSILIDWDPNSLKGIGLVEILDIYAYITSDPKDTTKPYYTVLMLKLRDIYYDEFDKNKEPGEIETTKKKFHVKGDEYYLDHEILEFLYMRDGSNFKWGRVGYTNGAFILKEMREYFRTLF